MTAQLQFPVRAERFCVLLTVHSVRDRLADFDLDADAIIAACAAHTLAPAFDLGLGGRKLLRILPSAVAFYTLSVGTRTRRIPLAEMFGELLRGHGTPARGDARPTQFDERLSGEQVRKIFNCEGGHINALVDAGELAKVPGTQRRLGPGGSDTITRTSVQDFLKRRML